MLLILYQAIVHKTSLTLEKLTIVRALRNIFSWKYFFLLDTFQQDSLKGGKWSNGAEMTEEEAAAEQQRMFAEARARMNGGAIATKQPESDRSLES